MHTALLYLDGCAYVQLSYTNFAFHLLQLQAAAVSNMTPSA